MNLIDYMSSISYLLFFANINGLASIQDTFDSNIPPRLAHYDIIQ
jgi:hypothetical protein